MKTSEIGEQQQQTPVPQMQAAAAIPAGIFWIRAMLNRISPIVPIAQKLDPTATEKTQQIRKEKSRTESGRIIWTRTAPIAGMVPDTTQAPITKPIPERIRKTMAIFPTRFRIAAVISFQLFPLHRATAIIKNSAKSAIGSALNPRNPFPIQRNRRIRIMLATLAEALVRIVLFDMNLVLAV